MRNIIHLYYDFFDCKLKNTTMIVGLIGLLILFVGVFIGGKYHIQSEVSPANILEVGSDNIMKIGNQEYRIFFEKLNTQK